MPNNNDSVILEGVLDNFKETAPTDLSDAQIFDLFAAEQILKDYDLSTDEISAGLTDGD